MKGLSLVIIIMSTVSIVVMLTLIVDLQIRNYESLLKLQHDNADQIEYLERIIEEQS